MSLKVKLLVVTIALAAIPFGVVSWLGLSYFANDKEIFVEMLGSEVTPVVAGEVAANVDSLQNELAAMTELALSEALGSARLEAAGRIFRRSEVLALRVQQGGRSLLSLEDDAALPKGGDKDVALDTLKRPDDLPNPGTVRIDNVTRLEGLPAALVTYVPKAAPDVITLALVKTDAVLHLSAASTFDTFVVDAQGRILVHPEVDKVVARMDASDLLSVQQLGEGYTGSKQYVGLDGETEVIGSYAPVGAGGLGVVQELGTEAVYGAVQALVQKVVLVGGAILVLALVIAFFVARGIARPVATLAESARTMGEGNFDVEIPSVTGGEVGELASAFKSMQEGLAQRDARIQAQQDALIQSEKMGALGQLAAGITHEVKNPMAGIIGFAQLCIKLSPEGSPLINHLKLIEKESKRAKDILENLLRFARQEEVEMVPLDPNLVLAETIKLVSHQLQISKVKVDPTLTGELPNIMGNMNQLQQVLMNLMMNASHAMQPKGGQLQVSTSLDEDGRVVLEVKDEGHGIKEEHKKRLFTPFFTTKEKGKGTGLGLSVSYGIIQQHQGEMRVWSQEGVGTIFYIYLPPESRYVAPPPKQEASEPRAGAPPA